MNIALAALGCRTNQAENETLRAELDSAGFSVVADPAGADVVIVNSCSVTSRTEAKVRQLLNTISRESPHAKIMVTGCMAEQRGKELLAIGNVAWVVGNARKQEIPAILRRNAEGVFGGELTRTPISLCHVFSPPASGGRTRLNLKIQEGCDSACAYCIVPSLRGPSRSAPLEEIVDLCRKAIAAGYKEIVLTGTHIGRFSSGAGERLPALVERLVRIDGDFRIRLSSLDPAEISGDLLALAGEGNKLCDHLHLSLQSLSPDVLKSMGRPNTTLDALLEKVAAFRSRYPNAGLGADFIVGFPGETDAQFETTLDNADKLGISYAHIFRFSARPGTAAAAFLPRVPEAVKRERSERFRAVVEKSRRMFIERQAGTPQRIIVEKERPVQGVTSNYLSVEVPDFSALSNSWLNVIIGKASGKNRSCIARPL
jgi:threonylcarbamoyladenosine tRNA methylthiotransferase MtaB